MILIARPVVTKIKKNGPMGSLMGPLGPWIKKKIVEILKKLHN